MNDSLLINLRLICLEVISREFLAQDKFLSRLVACLVRSGSKNTSKEKKIGHGSSESDQGYFGSAWDLSLGCTHYSNQW